MSLNQLANVNDNALTNLNIGCNDLQITCNNGSILSLRPPSFGTQGQVLTSDGNGNFEFKNPSGGSGNSNYYLYRKDNSISVPPSQSGKLNFNNANQQLSNRIYINHLDENKTDIDFYFSLIIPTDFIYIQDRTSSINWIKFEIVSIILFPNNYIDLTVTFVSGEGTGLINFGTNHEIFFSILSNSPAIQNRLNNLENKTEYQSTPTLNQTDFSGAILADALIKTGGTNTEYLMADGSILSGLYNIISDGTGESIIQDGTAGNTTFKLKDLIAGNNITFNQNSSDITINATPTISTLSTDGFGDTLIDPASTFPNFKIKSLLAGTSIALTPSNTDIIITNQSPASLITLNNSGTGSSLINTNLTSNPNLYLKSLSSGTGLSFLDTTNNLLLTNTSPASNINLSYVGAGNTLISSSTNPNFKIKGLIASTGIAISPASEDLTISADLSSVVLKAGDTMTGQLTVPSLIVNTGNVINSTTYFDSNRSLVSNQSNLYCQSGLDNLQTIVNNLIRGQGNSIQLSSGLHTIANISLTGEDFYLNGTSCPLYTNSSIISGNLIMGNQSFLSRNVRVNNIRVNGNLTFTNDSINQGLNYSFSNCDFRGASIQFVTSGVNNNFINFFDCTFNQNFTIPNNAIFYNFTRCDFKGFSISNNMFNSSFVTFEDCSGFTNLSTLGSCRLIGVNKTSSTSELGLGLFTYSSGNLPALQVKQITPIVTNGLTETIMTLSPIFGSYTWADTRLGQTKKWIILGAQTRGTFSSVYTIRLKISGVTALALVLPNQGPGTVSNIYFSIEITQVRISTGLIYWMRFISSESVVAGQFITQSQTFAGGIPALNISAPYTLTLQSSVASASLTVSSVDITNFLQ